MTPSTLLALAERCEKATGAASITAGSTFEFPYPFILEDFTTHDADGPATIKSWRPGTRFVSVQSQYDEDVDVVADGMGAQIVTVVSTHKPGPTYPERVFYTREWRTPAGHRFGKKSLRVTTTPTLKRLIGGYRHEFRLEVRALAARKTEENTNG